MTDHLYSFRTWSISKKFYDSLKPEHQKILLECLDKSTEYLNSIEEKVDIELLVKAQKAGYWQVIIPDRGAFKKAALPAIEEIKKDWMPGLYEQYVKPFTEVE